MTNDIDYLRLGKRIRYYRRKLHLTQEQLADSIDAAVSTVAHAENGSGKPSLPLLIKLSNALNVSLDQLLCDSLPVVSTYIDQDLANLLSDCSLREKRILWDIITAAKESLRKYP